MTDPATWTATQEYDWAHFIGLSSAEARQWLDEFKIHCKALTAWTDQSLALLRLRKIEEGYSLLKRVEDHWRKLESTSSCFQVMGRWYFGALAYYYYCVENFEKAEEALTLGRTSISTSIAQRPFLMPLAQVCQEFHLQRARIACRRRHWEEMRHQVEVARGMMANRLPLCALENGTEIYVSNLCSFYQSIPGLNESEREFLVDLLDDELRLRGFDQFARRLYALPGFVIPYL
ncbi:MAG TPA: hypothetical protein VGS07_21360 [Thermoanaerobaculia bacterium]|jgi:hypothetical protein|nr:hypothetical protein [Thermoanaerobaculia bacterium]